VSTFCITASCIICLFVFSTTNYVHFCNITKEF
jgi:hypothetical protein